MDRDSPRKAKWYLSYFRADFSVFFYSPLGSGYRELTSVMRFNNRLAGDRILVRELDRLTVYGRGHGIAVYELLAMAEDGAALPAWVTLYELGLAAYRARNFDAAAALFMQVLGSRASDQPARMMLQRCREFIASPPGDDWDASNAMQVK